MNYFAFLSFVSAVILFSLGIYVFSRNQKSSLHRIFLMLTLVASWWAFTEFMLRYPLPYPEAFLWMRLSAFWVFVPALSLNFIWIFTRRPGQKPALWVYPFIYGPAVMFCFLELATDLINQKPVLNAWGYSFGIAQNPTIYFIELFWGFFLMLLCLISCLHVYLRTEDPRKKKQVIYLMTGFGFPSVIAFLYFVAFPALGIIVPEMTIIFILFFSLFVGYAIWKYDLFVLTPATAADTILSTITDLLVLVDPERKIVAVNRAARDTLGYSEAELIHKPVDTILRDADGRPGILIEGRDVSHFLDQEMSCKKKDGALIPVSVSGSVIHDQSGHISGIVIVSRNISERKRAENALKQVLMKLNLLSSITRHDILNQVTALTAYLELARINTSDEKTARYLLESERIADVIYRQISFTRDYEEMGVSAPVWQDVADEIRKAASAHHLGKVRLTVDLGRLEIFADPLFEKIFYNLIDNALRYGGEQLSVIRISAKEVHGGLHLTCEDDGEGIRFEEKERIFRKGFGKHTGFGLFLVQEILSITGMTITENGIPGQGARFVIMVPEGAFRYAVHLSARDTPVP
jgi:PAS domain S-box-containing protein